MRGVGPHLMRGPRAIGTAAAVGLLGLMAAGCGGGGNSGPAASHDPGIVLGAEELSGSRSPAPSIGSDAGAASSGSVIDPVADLDIDDQRGDGSRVIVESLSTSLPGVVLVLVDTRGRTVASVPVTPGVQPVTVTLDVPLSRSQELRGVLQAPEGSGILVDDEGERVEEDFDYVIR